MKKLLVVLLPVLLLFALVSCAEPKAKPVVLVEEKDPWVVWGKSGSSFEDMKFNLLQYDLHGAKVKSVKIDGVAMPKTWASEHTYADVEALIASTGLSEEQNNTVWAGLFLSPEGIAKEVLYTVSENTVTVVGDLLTVMTSVKNIDEPLPARSVEIKFSDGTTINGVQWLAD